MKIKLLSDSTINRIAAGEVIERPASVVKELVENAIDAGSTAIDVILENAGKNLIIISDNGTGMSPEDLSLAVERHTTSKLDETDLLNISSFGFRGEALPSIGSVSKMLITSRIHNNHKAFQIQLLAGADKAVKPAIHNLGTKVEIRDLFYATPARLKFLRSDRTEFAACYDVVKKIALAHPNISINLSHDSKNIMRLRTIESDYEEAIKQRISDILGADFINNAAHIDFKRDELSLYGFTSIPTFNRGTTDDQFLFVNNRPVRDKLLQIALRIAYQDYLERDRHPISVLFLNINSALVDVNVHPAKTEVRFHDPNSIRSFLISAIKSALASKSHVTSTNIATAAFGLFQNNLQKHQPSPIKHEIISDRVVEYRPLIQTQPHARIEQVYPDKSDIPELDHRLGAAKAQLHETYIISQTSDSIIIIDQHAAHERIGYEKIKKAIQDNGLIKQRLLIPEIVELPDVKRAKLLITKSKDFLSLGLAIEKFSDSSILVTEVPSILGDFNVRQLIQDLGDNLLEFEDGISLTNLIEHVTETYACHYSIRAGRKLFTDEMNALLRQMEATPFSGQCNHGRPTYIELKLKDIEKLFGRI